MTTELPDWAALTAEFDHAQIGWVPIASYPKQNPTKLLVAAFVDARAIQERLDQVVGPQGWKTEYRTGPDGGVICRLSIKVGGEWVAKEDGAENTQVEAVKGGLSNALKRAAVAWGIGRYLYDLEAVWVECDDRKRFKAPQVPSSAGTNPPNVRREPAQSITRDGEFARISTALIAAGWLPETAEQYRAVIEKVQKCDFADVPVGKLKQWADKITAIERQTLIKKLTPVLGAPDAQAAA